MTVISIAGLDGNINEYRSGVSACYKCFHHHRHYDDDDGDDD